MYSAASDPFLFKEPVGLCRKPSQKHRASGTQLAPFVAAEVSSDLQQQRLCLANVARAAAVELAEDMPTAYPASLRSQLFSLFSEWSTDASPGMKLGEDRSRRLGVETLMSSRT